MDNPCKFCDNAEFEDVKGNEFGCDEPCNKATEFRNKASNSYASIIKSMIERCKK